MIDTATPLILASASPQRAALLAELSIPFIAVPSELPEPSERPLAVPPANWAQAVAYFKAGRVAEQYPDRWVLGADTLVVCGEEVLGKPVDIDDARRMLTLQAGREALVITGLALIRRDGGRERHLAHSISSVWLRDDAEAIERYLASGDWAGKAGAYGIQNVADELVERLEGSFSNVVGLPLETTGDLLRLVMAGDVSAAAG